MLIPYESKNIFIASQPTDFRMSIDALCTFIQREKQRNLHDGSIYVFYNKGRDKIKCLFWDRNGFVLYYKRLDKCKFKIRQMFNNVEMMSAEDLEIMLSGFEPKPVERLPLLLETHDAR
jgi:transposase